MVYVTNDVVDLAPTVLVPKVNVLHDFLPIFSMVCICLCVSYSLSELMQVYVYRLYVSNMQVKGGFARAYACVSTDTLGVVDGYRLEWREEAQNSASGGGKNTL